MHQRGPGHNAGTGGICRAHKHKIDSLDKALTIAEDLEDAIIADKLALRK